MTQEPADAADAWEGKFEDYKNPALKSNIAILCEPNALESDFRSKNIVRTDTRG